MSRIANQYYRLFGYWTNARYRAESGYSDGKNTENNLVSNMFRFQNVMPFQKSFLLTNDPFIVLATPGMLHGGSSLSIFSQMAGDASNLVILPGYCIPGTVGNMLIAGKYESI